MRKLLMTTAVILPLAATPVAFAQEAAQEPEEGVEATGETLEEGAEEAGQAVEEGAEEVGQAVEEGAEEAGQAVEEGAEEAGQAVEEGAEETGEPVEVEVIETEAPEEEADADQMEAEMAESEQIVREQAANELRLDWVTGTTITSADGEGIGDINDLILDGETGQIEAAIVGVGGFLGIGEKQIAVAWDELQIDYDANEISADLTREEAEAAPEYVFRDQEQPPAPAGMDPATGTVPAENTGTLGTAPMDGGAAMQEEGAAAGD